MTGESGDVLNEDKTKEEVQTQTEIQLPDWANKEELVRALEAIGFHSPKWAFRTDEVPIGELAPCSKKRKFRCDVVAYRDGLPVCVFELDGRHHVEERQELLDAQKEKILLRHGIRLWRMWNGELVNIREDGGVVFRRHVKAHMYAPYGDLASDWKKLCKCKKEA